MSFTCPNCGYVSATTLTHGGIQLDVESYEVRANGEVVHLSKKEFQILRVLMLKPNRVHTRENILDLVGDEGDILERTIDRHINNIRRKLGSCGNLIVTVFGFGYKMSKEQECKV